MKEAMGWLPERDQEPISGGIQGRSLVVLFACCMHVEV
jgi:hypothetical protein